MSDENVARECPTRAFLSYKSVQKRLGACFRVRSCVRALGFHLVFLGAFSLTKAVESHAQDQLLNVPNSLPPQPRGGD